MKIKLCPERENEKKRTDHILSSRYQLARIMRRQVYIHKYECICIWKQEEEEQDNDEKEEE